MERGKKRKGKRKKKGNYQDLGCVSSPSFSSHGGVGLDPFQHYAGSPTKPHKTRVYDNDEAHGPSCIRGPRVPHTHGRIHGVICGIL
jgi:hypothetical protein